MFKIDFTQNPMIFSLDSNFEALIFWASYKFSKIGRIVFYNGHILSLILNNKQPCWTSGLNKLRGGELSFKISH